MGKKRKGENRRMSGVAGTAAILFFLLGLSMMFYPLAANLWNSYIQEKRIAVYVGRSAELKDSGKVDYSEEWKKAYAYNASLHESSLAGSVFMAGGGSYVSVGETGSTEAAAVPSVSENVTGAADDENGPETGETGIPSYEDCLNLAGDGIMGYIFIPTIEVKIPIYHTTEIEVLKQGAGHMEGTSLPVGGEGTHAVIAAHRGLPGSSLFTDLDQVEVGDHFFLYILDEVLCYEVEEILVTDPYDTDSVAIAEGEDLVTLLTCTPYAVNTMRLLVRGYRVDYTEEEIETIVETESGQSGLSVYTSYGLWTGTGLIITGIIIIVLYLCIKKRGRESG